MSTPKLLIIEDDAETVEAISGYFSSRGYEVAQATTGPDGLERAIAGGVDALILDRLLPGLDGLAILATLRRNGIRTPAIMLSALGSVDERIEGLRAGGDDYLGKPFALAELAARVEALLRRPTIGPETTLRVGSLSLDLVHRTARRGGRELDLLPREFKLLEYLVRRAGQTVTRGMLFEEVWNYKFVPRSNLVDVHMSRLRRKLNGYGEEELITNVRGVGFILDAAS